jgi:hypothetical protein
VTARFSSSLSQNMFSGIIKCKDGRTTMMGILSEKSKKEYLKSITEPLSLSLSLYIYIYIYIYTHTHTHTKRKE